MLLKVVTSFLSASLIASVSFVGAASGQFVNDAGQVSNGRTCRGRATAARPGRKS